MTYVACPVPGTAKHLKKTSRIRQSSVDRTLEPDAFFLQVGNREAVLFKQAHHLVSWSKIGNEQQQDKNQEKYFAYHGPVDIESIGQRKKSDTRVEHALVSSFKMEFQLAEMFFVHFTKISQLQVLEQFSPFIKHMGKS